MALRFVLCAILLLVSTPGGPVFATTPSAIRSLAKLEAVRVVVEDFNTAMQKTGLQKGQLQARAEDYLKRNGFVVVPAHEPGAVPVVYIRLSSVIGGDETQGAVSFYLVVQVKQLVTLGRGLPVPAQAGEAQEAVSLLATTWENGTMAMLDHSAFPFYLQQTLTNLLGELVQDYQEASGKNAQR
jgi:hypothetical protein